MINKTIKGDLLKMARKGDFDLIAHGCNCFCTMGAGIAKDVARIYPGALEADKKTKKGDSTKLGKYTSYKCSEVEVINAYTQFHYGGRKPIDYDAVRNVFRRLNTDRKGLHMGIPMIGAGLAKGNWKLISSIINEETPDLNITLVEYKK